MSFHSNCSLNPKHDHDSKVQAAGTSLKSMFEVFLVITLYTHLRSGKHVSLSIIIIIIISSYSTTKYKRVPPGSVTPHIFLLTSDPTQQKKINKNYPLHMLTMCCCRYPWQQRYMKCLHCELAD